MSDPSDNESPTVIFRVFAETTGKVFLFYEPLAQRGEIEPPVTKAKLEQTKHKLLEQARAGRSVEDGSLMDFYMWHLMKLVPLVKLNEVLKLGEPLCYTQKRVGFLILLFQALVVIPSINTVLYYFKNRSRLAARPYDFLYEPGWQPEKKEATQ